MTTQHKITLTFLDLNTAKTIGWPLRYFASQLGLWANLSPNGLDTLQDKSQLTSIFSNTKSLPIDDFCGIGIDSHLRTEIILDGPP